MCGKTSFRLRFGNRVSGGHPVGRFLSVPSVCQEMEKFLLGNVDEGILNTDIRDEFKCCNVYAKEKCRKCFARFYCSGGCAANAYNFSGDICGAYDIGCELQKKRIECAIMIKAAEEEQKNEEE